jgi:hypothetical protein
LAQPVIELATSISERTGIPFCASGVSKVKSTAQLKDVFEREQRDEILTGAFAVDNDQTKGKRLLVFDDPDRFNRQRVAPLEGNLDNLTEGQVRALLEWLKVQIQIAENLHGQEPKQAAEPTVEATPMAKPGASKFPAVLCRSRFPQCSVATAGLTSERRSGPMPRSALTP